MVFLSGDRSPECLQCLASEPMTEAEAREAVRAEAIADPPGMLDCYPCPTGAGWHLTLAEHVRPPRGEGPAAA